jgi:TetR/AcrR family transcriptional regulator, transcriptional repressor for nem operon
MRYSKDHKAATHAKIVRNASVQLREKGARGVGVADLMKDVGLTHGGFYAHFDSRDDLVTEAVAYALAQNAQRWSELIGDKPVEARFPVLADSYLTPRHRDRPGEGCALAALAADVTREGPKTRRVFLNKLDNLVSLLAGVEGRPPAGKTRQKAISTIATMMGTLVLARIAGSGALSEEILEAGKSAARDGLAGSGANRKPAVRRRAGAAKPKRRVR